jgi:hypothetical protein
MKCIDMLAPSFSRIAEASSSKRNIPSSISLPKGLRLARITVTDDNLDPGLVYFLSKHAGRTLVFVNAINTLRKLSTLLSSLHIQVHTLHAHMQQKQRLSNLEAFRRNSTGVLVATDVAARGLDIPAVDHVLHYALPTTAETFVHRCGRTARGNATGLSIALVRPKDQRQYVRLCTVLSMSAGLSEFPVDYRYLKLITHRVSLARRISEEQASLDKETADAGWLSENAAAAELTVDDRSLWEVGAGMAEVVRGKERAQGVLAAQGGQPQAGSKRKRQAQEEDEEGCFSSRGGGDDGDEERGGEGSVSAHARRMRIRALRAELEGVLTQPVLPQGTSHKYITANPSMGQAAHPLQALVRVAAPMVVAAPKGSGGSASAPNPAPAQTRGGALVAPRVELPQEVMEGLRSAPAKPLRTNGQGKMTNKKMRHARALEMANSGQRSMTYTPFPVSIPTSSGHSSSALAALAAHGPAHAYIPGMNKGRVIKAGQKGMQSKK